MVSIVLCLTQLDSRGAIPTLLSQIPSCHYCLVRCRFESEIHRRMAERYKARVVLQVRDRLDVGHVVDLQDGEARVEQLLA
jgi:hypothetical protein